MINNPDEIREQLRLAGEKWAELDGAASMLEETKKSVRAKMALASGESSAARAEMNADASEVYLQHISSMVNARTKALRAKVNYDCLRTWSELVRTMESSRRAEMQMK